MDVNEMCDDTIMLERNNHAIPDTDETKEEQESFSLHKEMDSDDIPPSLLRYFETSKSRAAICEKLILEELEDFSASHHTENMMNLPFELNNDTMKPNVQVICDTENNENNTSTDTRLLPSPTETEALFTHNVSVCPNNEDEYIECERHLALEYEAEREKRHCEEMKKEEEKRQIERDFQKELKKLMEAENLHQKELELMGKRAQEKLEQELLLQQELISNLQRRVEGERRMREEEQKRMKDEEDKRKNEEEKIKIEAERKKMEDETRRKKEEERKIEELKLKEEERKHEEKRRMEREERRKREQERNMKDLEKKNLEDEMRMMKAEEESKKKEEEERIKKKEEKIEREEERKKIEEARKKMEKEKRKMEEQLSQKEEEERKKGEEENMRIEEEMRATTLIKERKMQEDMRKKKEEEEALKKMFEEMKKRDEREHGNVDEEHKLEERKKKEEKDRKRMDEEKEEARKREKERKKMKDKEVKEMVRKKAGEKVELRPIEEDEKRKKEDEINTKEEERRRGQKEEMRQEDEEGCDVDDRKVEHESKTKDKEKLEEEKKLAKKEMRRREDERKNVDAEKQMKEEEVGENKKQINKKTEEEIRVKEKEESKKRVVQGREEEERVIRANELQEKTENNSNNVDKTENTAPEDSTTWTSSSPDPLHSESKIGPTSAEAKPQQHDPEENTSQTSIEKTVDCKYQAARPSTVSVSLPVCLPEHTEKKRLSWMKDCIPWSKLCLQNRRKQKGSAWSRRGLRGAADASRLPPLCPHSLLQSTGWKSLQQVTTVTLEDLPGCSLSTLTQCTQLQSLTLRRCGLKSLDSINQLPQLCYIDVQENDISFVDCENMTSLRVLQLGYNKLTSIHGLTGAENVDVLDLSHNSITRIAGLESLRRLQRLSVDHNQLISTKGLRDVYTLLHLNCSHNHLASVEGLENSALLNTLDLRANSLTEPPSLNNQVLLRELHLDDNSISSLQGLTACWLPLMQHFSVAQNGITQLPSMSDFVSLANLDLRFNCMSELQNVCESLEGCQFLREVHLTGNPLQQERGWRSSLQKAVPGLSAIDDQETDSFLMPPAVQQVILASGSFLMFCRTQLQQTRDLQQQHIRELSNASSSLDAVKTSCQHLTEVLQLAKDQRFAHEYGDTTVADKLRAAGQTTPEETPDMDRTNNEKKTERPEMESTGKVQPVLPNRDNIRCKYWTFEEKLAAESRHDTFNTVASDPKTGPTVNEAISGSVHSSATKGKTFSSNLEMAPVSNHQELDLQNTAAVMIQQLWSKYRQKCGNSSSPSTAEKGGGRGGDGGEPESGPSYINRSVVGQDYAATVIQAFWRGFTLRRRLASALAAVTCPDTGEDDTFEEVDVDEFVFDEAALEKHWTFSLTEDSPPRRSPVPEEPLSPKPPVHFPEPSQYTLPPPLVWRPKQAWMPGEQVDSAGQRVSPESSNRSKSPASTSKLSGLSERSEKILEEWGFTDSHTALLMLKRAQKMKSTKQQQKKRRDPSVRLAFFRNCSYQLGPVEAQNRPAQHNRNDIKVSEAALDLQQAEKVERVKQEQAQQWLHTPAVHSDRDSESVHFLPEISSDILNGGRVQLVADPGYTQRLHHTSGLWANNILAVQPCKEDSYLRSNSLGHARKEVPSPRRVTSSPSKRERERISYRDNPVQLSGGWGGGKKRDKVYK